MSKRTLLGHRITMSIQHIPVPNVCRQPLSQQLQTRNTWIDLPFVCATKGCTNIQDLCLHAFVKRLQQFSITFRKGNQSITKLLDAQKIESLRNGSFYETFSGERQKRMGNVISACKAYSICTRCGRKRLPINEQNHIRCTPSYRQCPPNPPRACITGRVTTSPRGTLPMEKQRINDSTEDYTDKRKSKFSLREKGLCATPLSLSHERYTLHCCSTCEIYNINIHHMNHH